MMFPNAHEGVKKIYKSQILALIGAALLVFAAIFAAIMTAAIAKDNMGLAGGMSIATVLFSIGSAVLMIIGLIFYIIGINRAKADEPSFTKALICVIVSLVCSVIAAIFSKNAVVKNIMQIVQSLANLAATVFIILGIQQLAKQLNREDIVNHGKTTMYILAGIYAAIIVACLLAVIFANNTAVMTAAGIITIIASILSIVQYVVYLVFLKRSAKMLEA